MAYRKWPPALPVIRVGLFGHCYVGIEKESIPGDVLFKRNVLILISHFTQVAASLAISLQVSDGTPSVGSFPGFYCVITQDILIQRPRLLMCCYDLLIKCAI